MAVVGVVVLDGAEVVRKHIAPGHWALEGMWGMDPAALKRSALGVGAGKATARMIQQHRHTSTVMEAALREGGGVRELAAVQMGAFISKEASQRGYRGRPTPGYR